MIEKMQKVLLPKPHHIPLIVMGFAVVVLSIGLVMTLLQRQAYVASGNMYIAALTQSIAKSEEVRVAVRISPGTRVDTVTASVTYDTDSLTYIKAVYTDSPFTTQIPAKTSGNTVTVQSAKLGGGVVEADALIATLLFTSKKDGASLPMLVYGNAAYAGTATSPTIAGKKADESKNPLTTAQQTATTALGTAAQQDSSTPALFVPFKNLLQSLGTDASTARNAAPWLAGILLSIVLTGAGIAAWFLYKRYKKKIVQEESVT
jgi:hypothetical protein